MVIREVSKDEKNIIDRVVGIHLDTFKGFFLSFMGKGFLKQMYASFCSHEGSGLLVAQDGEGKTVGFIAYSCNMSELYKYMIKKRLVPFAWYSFGALLRNPKIFTRLAGAFLKPSESRREETFVELASIGVAPEAKLKGVGSALVNKLKSVVDFDKYKYINLETDAVDNELANGFYGKHGFKLVREYTTREGRKMNEYRFFGPAAENCETVDCADGGACGEDSFS